MKNQWDEPTWPDPTMPDRDHTPAWVIVAVVLLLLIGLGLAEWAILT
jgi:hypothetical protein